VDRTPRRGLFVAAGPSATQSLPYLGRVELVTFNMALNLLPAPVDLALFGSENKLRQTQENHHKAEQIIWTSKTLPLPRYVSAPLWWLPTPAGGRCKHHKKLIRKAIREGQIVGRISIALYALYRLGFRQLWLFGCDGGHQRAAELALPDSRRGYDSGRFCAEETARYLNLDHAFWPKVPTWWNQ